MQLYNNLIVVVVYVAIELMENMPKDVKKFEMTRFQ